MFPQAETLTSLTDLFETLLGAIPPEFEGLVYVFFVFFLLQVVDSFFIFLRSVFEVGVGKWRR